MYRTFIIFKAFIRLFLKDKVNLFFTFFFNAFLMIIFGLTVEDRYNLSVDLGLVDYQKSERSIGLADYLAMQPNANIVRFESEKELKDSIENGSLVAGVVLQPGSDSSSSLSVNIIGDPSRKMWLEFLEPGLRLATLESNKDLKPELEKTKITTEYVESKNLTYFDFIFPGLLAFALMQTGLAGGLTLLSQRCNESLKRLKITPLKKSEFLLGYTLSYGIILVLQTLLYVLLAVLIFNYSFSGSIVNISLITILTGFIFLILGILLSNWAKSVEVGGNFNRFFTFPAAFLCGVFVPLNSLPEYLQKFAQIHPLTHLVEILRGIANYSEPIATHYTAILVLTALTVLFGALAVFLFKWEEQAA